MAGEHFDAARGGERPARDARLPAATGPERSPIAASRPGAADRERRRARRARGRFFALAAVIAGALAAIGFLAGSVLDPLAGTDAAAIDPASVPIAHPSPAGIPAAALEPGQCFATWTSAWASDFALADCAQPHAAQLLAEVDAAPSAGGAYPGDAALRARAQFACQQPSVLDPARATATPGLVIDVAYAPDAAAWDAGEQRYRCFAAIEGGGTMTGSLAPAAS